MKVVVLGFDGMEPSVVDALRLAGDLPTFDRLATDGIETTVRSTVIPMSPAAWSSFLTGTNPGKHGIYDFITRTGEGINDFEVVSAEHRRAPTLWQYCNANGLRAGVVGVPVTYPAAPLDGFMVSGFPTPRTEGSYSPESLSVESPVPIEALHPSVLYDGTNATAFIDDQFRLWDAMAEFQEFALTQLDWDVYVSVFKGTDDIAHVAWDDEPLMEAYRRADGIVERTLDALGELDEETLLIVMSDHGFGPIEKTLFPNNVLLELGYARLRRSPATKVRRYLSGRGLNLLSAYRLLARLGLAESVLSISYEDSRLGGVLDWLRDRMFLGPQDLDPGTPAFSRGNFGQIFVEDDSIDQEALRQDLLAFEVDGEPVIDAVFTAEEEFHGPMTDRAPEVMIGTPDYRYVASRGFALATNRVLAEHPLQRAADHKPTGVFFAHGAGVDPVASPQEVALEDLLPTIFAAMGVPIPEIVDGTIIDGFDVDHPGFEAYELSAGEGDRRPVDEESIRDQLESLGYMG